jgi:hypothetical protein
MNLSQALKQKNRLAGELVRHQQILLRENSKRSDSVSTVDRYTIWLKIQEISDELGVLKGKISTANIGIYPLIERMAELKSRIAYVASLPKREGEEKVMGYQTETLTYKWDSFINQEKSDKLTFELQEKINELQDKIDNYNATTNIV